MLKKMATFPGAEAVGTSNRNEPSLVVPIFGHLNCIKDQRGQPNVALYYHTAENEQGVECGVPIEAFEAAEAAFKQVLISKGLTIKTKYGTPILYRSGIGEGGVRRAGNEAFMGSLKRLMKANGFEMAPSAREAKQNASEAGSGDDPTPDIQV